MTYRRGDPRALDYAHIKVFSVRCPTCGAIPGNPCRIPSGATTVPHATRYRASQ